MRGLVVVVAIMLLAVLFLNPISAETKKSVEAKEPVSIVCELQDGTVVHVKATTELKNLKIGDICYREEVPAGWNVYCKTDKDLSTVSVSFVENEVRRETSVVCG